MFRHTQAFYSRFLSWIALVPLAALMLARRGCGKPADILNVSYDPTRELYKDFNKAFAKHWKEKTGETLSVQTRTAARASRPAR